MVPRHSWLGSASGCSVWSLATPVCGCWLRFPATPGWGPPAAVGCFVGAGGCPVLCVFLAWAVARGAPAFVFLVLLVVWCSGVGWVFLPPVLVCVRACAWCVVGLWLLVPPSLRWGLRLVFVWVWLVCVVVGPSPVLVGGPGCSSPPLLAGVCRSRWWLVPRQSWLRVFIAVPRHSWQGFARCGGGGSLATPGCGPRGLPPVFLFWSGLACGGGVVVLCPCVGVLCCGWRPCSSPLPCCVCVCVVWRLVLVWVVCGVRVWCACSVCVCVCVRCVVCRVCHTWFDSHRRPTWSR